MGVFERLAQEKKEFEVYKLHETLLVWEAAALALDIPPSQVFFEDWNNKGWFAGFDHQHRTSELKAMIKAILRSLDWKENSNEHREIEVDSFKAWLNFKGHKSIFFGTGGVSVNSKQNALIMKVLDPNNEHYSKMLAASIYAWFSLYEREDPKGKPKQTIKEWIGINGESLGFNRNSRDVTNYLSDNSLDLMSGVVNWERKGGSPNSTAENANPRTLEEVKAMLSGEPVTENSSNSVKIKDAKDYKTSHSIRAVLTDDDIPY